MVDINRQRTAPIDVPRTVRNHPVFTLTSFQAGVMAPVAAIPLFREDSLSTHLDVALEMMETHELLLNPVNMRVMAYLVPWLAMDRFEGSRDQFDRSYAGQPKVDGGAVVPFFSTVAMGTHGANPIFKTLGEHAPAAQLVNTMFVESYNQIWNFRARNRSKHLTERLLTATSLAPAFWDHSRFRDVLPSFDQRVIDGEVALTVVNSKLKVSGIGVDYTNSTSTGIATKDATTTAAGVIYPNSFVETDLRIRATGAGASAVPDVYAEMAANGITVSLANIELATKLKAFAKLREQFEGLSDDWIIDNFLLNGLQIPDQALKQPILLADQTVRIDQMKRWASDSANLAASAVSGGAKVSIGLHVPRLSTGGMVMVVVECVPEQLFERERNQFLYVDSVADLPDFQRDFFDPVKVDVVLKGDLDAMHTTPTQTAGYRPLNAKWNTAPPKVGGKFLKPASGSANDAERRRIWAVETVDPTLSADFYVVNAMHTKPFLNTTADPFELAIMGNAVIEGNTVFGGPLSEDTGNWDAVEDKVPTTQP